MFTRRSLLIFLAVAFAAPLSFAEKKKKAKKSKNVTKAKKKKNQEPEKIVLTTDMKYVEEIRSLYNLEFSSDWEKDILGHKKELVDLLKNKQKDPDLTFQHIVAQNQRSSVTNDGVYFTYVVSLPKGLVLRFHGDDLFLIEKGKKEFTPEERKFLAELYPFIGK